MISQIRPALTMLIAMTALTGILYPVAMTRFAAAMAPGLSARTSPRPFDIPALGIVLAATAGTTLLCLAADRFIPVRSLSLIYMTMVVAIAARFGLWPSVWAGSLGFLCYNFFFTTPRFTFQIWNQGQFLTLILFLIASIITGNLTARLRSRMMAQKAIADRTRKLYDFSRKAASAASFDDAVWAAVSHVATVLECESILLTPHAVGELQIVGPSRPRTGWNRAR
ncbi:DUF4118 domain-containing protein [Paracoccus ravus]|uniref:DUF4118 domain-containing protein n=1 Tax=Paracoccus ravus TaxID=2447760 RepID=UPI00106E2133|nr:DUF4118 domain-containing protein [Paracoccus ravus]